MRVWVAGMSEGKMHGVTCNHPEPFAWMGPIPAGLESWFAVQYLVATARALGITSGCRIVDDKRRISIVWWPVGVAQ